VGVVRPGVVRAVDRLGVRGLARAGCFVGCAAGADIACVAGWVLARSPRPTTTTLATDITNLIPRLTHVLLSPREPFLMQLVRRQAESGRCLTHGVHPLIGSAHVDVVPPDIGDDPAHRVLVGPRRGVHGQP
jgi:hypothetical protein